MEVLPLLEVLEAEVLLLLLLLLAEVLLVSEVVAWEGHLCLLPCLLLAALEEERLVVSGSQG